MTHPWDEFSKSLSEKSVPRRQSLRLLGAVLAGALLSPLGLGTAWAGGPDPCKSFCKCRNKQQQNNCLAACRACNSDTSRLCGSCGSGYACTDLGYDFYNCGACGYLCQEPGPYEEGACIDGECVYACAEGAVNCDGRCTSLAEDPYNCGACGNVCDDSGPNQWNACVGGECVYGCASGTIDCNGVCTRVYSDPDNCGACGNVCGEAAPYCYQGACTSCAGGAICDGQCVNFWRDSNNCGGCGIVCPEGTACSFGACQAVCPDCGY